jgi:diacylglycerol kinase family enzyme
MALTAIINPSSGSVPADAATLLQSALEELGEGVSIRLLSEGGTLADVLGEVSSSRPDAVIVWAGDGTVAGVLDAAGPEGLPVLALPGGTMNLLHKAIHGEADWKSCLSGALKSSGPSTIPAGVVDGRKFYVAAMLGNLTHFAESREALRAGNPLEAVAALSQTPVLDLETTMDIRADHGGEAGVTHLPATAAAVLPSIRLGGGLEVGAIDPANILELTATGLAAMFRDWREVDTVERVLARTVIVEHRLGAEIHATLDGEITMLPSRVIFSRIDAAARVLSARA